MECTLILISTFQTLEWHEQYICILASTILNPIEFTSYFVFIMHILRFLLLVNLNNMKSLFCKKDSNQQVTLRLKLLKIATAPWFTLITAILVWIFTTVVLVSILGGAGFSCRRYNNTDFFKARNIFLLCFGIIMMISGASELSFDIISNYKLITKNWYTYLFKKDAYLYRIELLICGIIAIGMVIESFLLFASLVNPFIDSIITMILYALLHMSLTAFPVCLTIFKIVKKKRYKKRNNKNDELIIEQLLNDETGRELFLEYSKREWSTENIMLWVKI